MPTSSPSAVDFFKRKQSVPSGLRSQEWSFVSAQIRERSFFMAAVDNARTLQAFRNEVADVLQGKKAAGQAREAMRRFLRASGYTAPEGKAGTMQDLSSNQRLKVSIETNVALARNWQQRQELLGDMAHPALELYRAGQARYPRNWSARWREAAAKVNFSGVAKGGDRMVALTESPIWRALSAFDLPYPPFDYGSHMSVRPVRFSEARELGLFDEPEGREQAQAAADIAARGGESLNEHLEVDASEFAEELLRELQRQLKGLMKIEHGKIACTDPNGTKQYSWSEIGEVITGELPEGMANLQARAFKHWVEDSSNFREGQSGKREERRSDGSKHEVDIVSEEERQHMVRLVNRIKPTRSDDEDGGMISRALHFTSQEDCEAVMALLKKDEYKAQEGVLGESWNNNELTVRRFANKKFNIVLRCSEYKSRRRIDGLYKHIRVDKHIEGLGISTEGESIMPADVRYKTGKITPKKNKLGGITYEVEVREI